MRRPRLWSVLLSESFRAWAALLIALSVNVILMLAFGKGLDDDPFTAAASLGLIGFFLVSYVALSLSAFLLAPHAEVAGRATRQRPGTFLRRYLLLTQPGGGLALYFAVGALVIGLLVLPRASEIAGPHDHAWVTGITVATVFMGWLAVAVTYAIDYLVVHRQSNQDALTFPGTPDPRFSDYLYLSVGMSTSYAPPDVSVRSTAIRRRMTIQMLISFAFATMILAAVVSLALTQLP